MEFRILGPLEVRSQGRALPLGGPKQRAVLAYLLLHSNEVVAVDTLVDELWGERPPKTVEAYVQNCISRLRKLLGRERVETRPPGYLLRVDAEDLDAVRFERALDASRSLEPAERASALREALALWRSAPLADLAFESFAQGEIARLEELRLAAQEERLSAELELGHHTEALPELEALATRHPARERLRGIQMLALHRAGRTRDALQAYQGARLALVEDLGVEPGDELRALYRTIIEGRSEAGPVGASTAGGQRRTVAFLLAELMPREGDAPELQREREAAWLSEAAVAVERHGGELRQLLGEEVVAVFGLQGAHEDDILRALRAAADLRTASPAADDRIAVDRGQATADDTGLATSVAQTRLLKEAAAPRDLLVGPGALATASAALDVVPHESALGFRVLRFHPDADPFARHFDAPLVGRAEELARLEAALDDVVQGGAPRRVVVVGEPGIGKTRLATELATRAGSRARVLTGRCVAYGDGATYLPLLQILDQVGPLEQALAPEPDADRIASLVRGRAFSEQTETLWAVRRLLEAVAREQPVVLVLEDLHWAQPAFLDLVEYLAGWAQAPLLLVCVARQELLDVRPEWREESIALEPLSPDEAQELAAALPGQHDPERSRAAVDAAEGNPLFLEQLLAFGAEGEAGAVPPTLEALLGSRLDLLSAGERAVLERAAVAGREFWRSAIDALTPDGERAAAGSDLMALVRRRLVRPEPAALEGEDGFRFHHVLIRDVAYTAIPEATRAALHERLGRWLDGHSTDMDELVGYHLERAAVVRAALGEETTALAEEAGRRLGEAGVRALKRVDAHAAVNLLSRATALLPEGTDRRELEWALGTAMKFAGNAAGAQMVLDRVEEQARERGERRIELRAQIEQAWRRLSRSETTPEAALELLDDAVSAFENAGDEDGLARARHLCAAVLGEYALLATEAEAVALRVRDHYRRSGFSTGGALSLLAVTAYRGPTPVPDAIARCEQLLVEAETPVWRSFILPPYAGLHAMGGRFGFARERLAEARALREEFADTGTIVTGWSAVAAAVELLAGDPEAAGAILRRSLDVLREADDAGWLATNTALLAEADYRRERYEEALALAQDALRAAPPGHLTSRSVAQRVKAMAFARLDRLEKAEQVARATVAMLASVDAVDERAEAAAALAEVLMLKGDSVGASESWDDALALFERRGNVVSAERVRRRLPALR